jgi:GxxExxY protein
MQLQNSRKQVTKFTEADDPLSFRVIGAAIQVHRVLGPGLLESVYEECLAYELSKRGICFERQKSIPVQYEEVMLDCGFRIDLLVENCLILELKAVSEFIPVHAAQILTYMKLAGCRKGLLINFNVPVLIEGIERYVV